MPQLNISEQALKILKEAKEEVREKKGRVVTYSETIENMRVKK